MVRWPVLRMRRAQSARRSVNRGSTSRPPQAGSTFVARQRGQRSLSEATSGRIVLVRLYY